MTKARKLILCFGFLLCAVPLAVQAAAMPKGQVQNIPPVQPQPQGMFPNYQNNINSPPEDLAAPNSQDQADTATQPAAGPVGARTGAASSALVWVIAVILAGVGLLAFFIRQNSQGNKQ